MSKKSDSASICSVVTIRLYVVAIFNTDTRDEPTLRAFFKMDDALNYFNLCKDNFPYVFTKDIFVTRGHPLYNFSEIAIMNTPIIL